jgi:hypothetical protein
MNAGIAAPAGFEPGQRVTVDGVPGIIVGAFCLPIQFEQPDGSFRIKSVPAAAVVAFPPDDEPAAVLPMKLAR